MARSMMSLRAKAAILASVVVASLGTYTWWQYSSTQREMQQLRTAVRNLEETYPIARIVVVEQVTSSGDQTQTHVRLTFVNSEGQRRGEPVEATLNGSRIYFEALLMIFQDRLVELGERRTMAFPTRLFTEVVPPKEGVRLSVLDEEDVPVIYEKPEDKLADVPLTQYRDVLRRFWKYANEPEEAARYGIKVLQGQAVFTDYQIRRYYTIRVKSNGGMEIVPENFWLDEAAGRK
jgi:hypothetical protein